MMPEPVGGAVAGDSTTPPKPEAPISPPKSEVPTPTPKKKHLKRKKHLH